MESILDQLLAVFKEKFQNPELLKPRLVTLEDFGYINDEEIDIADEAENNNAVTLEEAADLAPDRLEPLSKEVPMSAVDAASARIGETDQGLLFAVRVAILIQDREEEKARCLKYGPYMVHITDTNKNPIYNYFRKHFFNLEEASAPYLLTKTGDRIRNFIERLAQRMAVESIKEGIALWDGCLAVTVDTPQGVLKESLDVARANANSVVAVSKRSTLKLKTGERILGLLDSEPRACFRPISGKVDISSKHRYLGEIYVVKFTPDGFSFRVDVAPVKISSQQVLQLLQANSAFYNGYPELLRQAHIQAYFTPNEVLALQNYAIDQYRLKVVRPFDVRRHLLAPFG